MAELGNQAWEGQQDLRGSLAAEAQLNTIYQRIVQAESLGEIIWTLEQEILALLGAERLTIYRRDASGHDIVSWYRTSDEDLGEIRVPMSPSSIAGYVAMSHQPLKIDDVYDSEALRTLHPSLRFDYSYDQSTGFVTESMVVVPIIFKETLLGVMQLINRTAGGPFSDQDVIHALAIAQVMAEKFRHELKSTAGPWEYLIESGKLKLEDLEALEDLAEQEGKSLPRLLQKNLKLGIEELGASLEHFYQVPFMAFSEEIKPDPELIQQLNVTYLARHFWVPFTSATEGETIILLDDPNDAERIMEIQYLLNSSSYEFRVGLRDDILRFLGFEIAEEDDNEIDLEGIVGKIEDEAKLQEAAAAAVAATESDEELDENASPIVQLVNQLIVEAVEMNASDIHIEPCKDTAPAVVRMRVDGVCRPVLQVPYTHIRAVVSRIKVLSRLDIAERRKPQDGKMTIRVNGEPVELRVATLPTVHGESAVLRILARGEPLPFEKLNFSERNKALMIEMLAHPHGLILVVGPTGSGKTTTLHGVLGYVNKPDVKILTAEDPVEITQPGLQQVQIAPKIGYTFAMALRAFLRCDPDIILIGEMRDQETAHAGIEASLTGHLVFSTLHTNSAPETVTRLLDMGLDPLNFADAFVGVLAQRLCRTLCKECKEEYKPDAGLIERLKRGYGLDYWPELKINDADIKLCRPKGCKRCGGTGYRGRTGVHELLAGTDPMKAMISKKGTVTEIKALAMKEGMRTVRQDGILKILRGQTDLEQLLEVTSE